jgi:hypothetical protein
MRIGRVWRTTLAASSNGPIARDVIGAKKSWWALARRSQPASKATKGGGVDLARRTHRRCPSRAAAGTRSQSSSSRAARRSGSARCGDRSGGAARRCRARSRRISRRAASPSPRSSPGCCGRRARSRRAGGTPERFEVEWVIGEGRGQRLDHGRSLGHPRWGGAGGAGGGSTPGASCSSTKRRISSSSGSCQVRSTPPARAARARCRARFRPRPARAGRG